MNSKSEQSNTPESPERRRLGASIAWALGGFVLPGCGGGGDASATASSAAPVPSTLPVPSPAPASPPAPAPSLPPPPPPATTTVSTLAVRSTGAGTFPYSATVLPLRGQLPAGNTLESPDDASLRLSILSSHDDGSAAVVVVSGTVTVSANTLSVVRLQKGSVAAADASLTVAAIAALVNQVSVDFGNYGRAAITDFSQPERVWWANAGTICARYRVAAPAAGSTALEAVVDIHAWAGRALVEVVVENCKMVTASPVAPASASYTGAVVAINGATVFTVNGNGAPEGAHARFRAWYASGWVGGDPGLRVTQSHTDLQQHPLLFKCDQTSAFDMSVYAADAYTPWATGRQRASNMGGGGDHDSIGPLPSWEARALQSGDYRAWRATEANALVINGYGINYRDSSSGTVPTFAQMAGNKDQRAYGFWPAIADNGRMGWEANHAPAVGLMAFIARPSPIYIELAQKVAFWQGTWSVYADGAAQQATGVFGAAYQLRGKAWCLRQLAHATFLTPDAMTAWKASARTSLAQNVTYLDQWRTDGKALLNAMWDNRPTQVIGYPIGPRTGETTNAQGTGLWQYHYLLVELHKAAATRLLSGAAQVDIDRLADWCALQPVRWVNEQPNGAWRYIPYATAVGRNATSMDSLPTWGQQMDWWHDDAVPAVSGGWFGTGGFPHSYSGYVPTSSASAGYNVYYWSALVAAVERDVAGAATAWNTVQTNLLGLQSWRTGFGQDPRWGSTPRSR